MKNDELRIAKLKEYLILVVPISIVLNWGGTTSVVQYLLAIATFAFGTIVLSYFLFVKSTNGLARMINRRPVLDPEIIILKYLLFCITAGALIVWMKRDLYPPYQIIYGSYFFKELFSITVIALGAGLTICFFVIQKSKKIYIFDILSVGLCLLSARMFYFHWMVPYDIHMDAYYYPVYRVASGQAQYIDFKNIYGSYCYILAPFIHSPENAVRNFSMAMSFLVFGSLICIWGSLKLITKNHFYSFVGLSSCGFYLIIFFIKQQGNGYYLQFMPHRIFFPVLCLLLNCVFLKVYERKISLFNILFRIMITGITVLALMWNFESGTAVAIANTSIYLIIDWNNRKSISQKLLKTLFEIILFAAEYVLFLILVAVCSYVAGGVWITFSDVLFGINTFSKSSFPLSFGMGMIIYGVMLPSIISHGVDFMTEEDHKSDSLMKLYLDALFVILSIYTLEKKEHAYNITPIVFFICMLLCIYLSSLSIKTRKNDVEKHLIKKIKLKRIENKKELFRLLPDITVKMLGTFFYIFTLSAYLLEYPKLLNIYNESGDYYTNEICTFLKGNLSKEELEHTNICMNSASYIYTMMGVWDYSELYESIDWFGDEDRRTVLSILEKTDNILVIDDCALERLALYDSTGVENRMRFEQIMKARYQKPIVSENGLIRVYFPK